MRIDVDLSVANSCAFSGTNTTCSVMASIWSTRRSWRRRSRQALSFSVQVSAHGAPRGGATPRAPHRLRRSLERRVAPGQLVAWYIGDEVYGSAMAR